jgi:hypothetical protein
VLFYLILDETPSVFPGFFRYVFDYQGTSPMVSGMYFDDWWSMTLFSSTVTQLTFSCSGIALLLLGIALLLLGNSLVETIREHNRFSNFKYSLFWLMIDANCRRPESGGFPDPFPNMVEDMGLTAAEQKAISKSYVV